MNDDARPRYRSGSLFGCRWRKFALPQLAELLSRAEAFDRRTHTPGKHGGAIGRTGLAVLRALVTRFYNKATGQLDPSLAAIAKAANVARSTVQEALARLEACGFLERTRRIVRVRVRCVSSITGQPYEAERLIQTTNGYRLSTPPQPENEVGSVALPRAPRTDTGRRSGTTDIFIPKPPLALSEAITPLADAMARWKKAIFAKAATA